jgi:hypothetical protein
MPRMAQAADLLRNDFIFFIFYSTTLKSTKNNKRSPCPHNPYTQARPLCHRHKVAPQRQGLTAIALKNYTPKPIKNVLNTFN